MTIGIRKGSESRLPARFVVTVTLLLVLIGCGSPGESTDSSNPGSPDSQAGVDLPQGNEPVDLDPADFTTEIDNTYWPMVPGTRWTYREWDSEGNVMDIVVVVTTETKEIANGITARVVRDTVMEDGEIVEDTFDWYAQDSEGNIWYLGEDTAEFEDGEVVSTERIVGGRRRRGAPRNHHPRKPDAGHEVPPGVLRR